LGETFWAGRNCCCATKFGLPLLVRIQGSALVTLGVGIEDLGAWLFIFWLCIDWYLNVNKVLQLEVIMKAAFKTGMDLLAALWGQFGEQPLLPKF
jgi:hypothetical protein